MARVVYFKSAINPADFEELTKQGSINQILTDLKIQKDPLCVTINGETPDEVDLSYLTKSEDVIEIRQIVHGNDAGTKSSLATIVQLATLAVVAGGLVVGWPAVALTIGASLISGALMRRAQELSQGRSESPVKEIETNNYSLSNAKNQARPLDPIPLVMGTHRMAPDMQTDAYTDYFLGENTTAEQAPVVGSFYPGVESSNGAHNSGNNWAIMPAGYIDAGFPAYPIKIAPYHFGVPIGPLSPAKNTEIINKVRDHYLNNGSVTINFWDVGSEFTPLVIYHNDPSDPLYRRYNLFHFLARYRELHGTSLFSYFSDLDGLYSGVDAGSHGAQWYADSIAGGNKNAIKVSPVSSVYYYPSTVANSDNSSTVISKIGTYLTALNNGNLASNKTDSYSTEKQLREFGITEVVKEAMLLSTQTFNYGLGDLSILDRRIGGVEVDISPMIIADHSPINKANWRIPSKFDLSIPMFTNFYQDVLSMEGKTLSNDGYPETPIDPTDMGIYNFTYFEGQIGLNCFSCSIVGNVYSTNTSTGFGSNTTRLEVQWKYSDEEVWRSPDENGLVTIQNNNTKKVAINYFIGGFDVEDRRIQVRIRKVTQDKKDDPLSGDNEKGKTARMSVENVRFFRDQSYGISYDYFKRNMPMNLEGLSMSSMVSDSSQTDKYTATVFSRCWYWDFEEERWVWESTLNPAWWFLYFAHGGFLVPGKPAGGPYSYPYRPSPEQRDWVNYPNHPEATEHIFGVGLSDEEIDLEKIFEWAQFCDENDLQMSMILKDDTSCSDVLERIANTGRGSVTYNNGKLSVVYEDKDQVATGMFGMGNILPGSFSVEYNLSDPIAKIIGTYIQYSEGPDWESQTVEAQVPFANPKNLKTIEINLEGIIFEERAQREVNLLAARQFYQKRSYSWSVDVEGLIAKRGDLVYLSHDSTQYGFSGRIRRFNVVSGVVQSIETSSDLDDSITHVTIRHPDGTMAIYECHIEGSRIIFDEPYPLGLAPFQASESTENNQTDYPKSIPEDFIFIAGAKETPGKLVRIAEISCNEDMTFNIRAIDEDPAMWAYEYGESEEPESFDDAEVTLKVANLDSQDLGQGRVKVLWECINGDFVQIINKETGLPIEANGSFSFSGGQVVLELVPGKKYNLELRPFSIGAPYRSEVGSLSVWPK